MSSITILPKKYIEFKYDLQPIYDKQLQTLSATKYYFIVSFVSNFVITKMKNISINLKDELDKWVTDKIEIYHQSCAELVSIIKGHLLTKYDNYEDKEKFVADLKSTLFEGEFKDPDNRFDKRNLFSGVTIKDFNKHLEQPGNYHSFFSGIFEQLETYFKQKIKTFIETHDYGGFNLASGNKSFLVNGEQYNLFSNRVLLPISGKSHSNEYNSICELADNIIPGNNCHPPNRNLDSDVTQYKGNNFWWNNWNGMPKTDALFVGKVNENSVTVQTRIDASDFELQDCRIIYLFEKMIPTKHHCYLITQSSLVKYKKYLNAMGLMLIDENLKSTFVKLNFKESITLEDNLSEKDKNLCVYDIKYDNTKNIVKLYFFNWFNKNAVTRFSLRFKIPSDLLFAQIISRTDLIQEINNVNGNEIDIQNFLVGLENYSLYLKTNVIIESVDSIAINNDILIGPFLKNNNLLLQGTKEKCNDKTCEEDFMPEEYKDIIIQKSERSCWIDKYDEKNTCAKLLFKSMSFSFGTPFIRLTNGKLLGVGHIKMLTDSNIYKYESEYVAKIQSNIKIYMDSLNTYKQHSVNCVIGYNYFSYFILFDETTKTFFISDFFLCSNETNKYKFSLTFTTGIFEIGNDIYISSGDGDYYSNILVFDETVILRSCVHDALSSVFAFEQMRFLLFYKRTGGNIDVINFDSVFGEDIPPTCFGRLCSARSSGGYKKHQKKTKKHQKKTKKRGKLSYRNIARSKQ